MVVERLVVYAKYIIIIMIMLYIPIIYADIDYVKYSPFTKDIKYTDGKHTQLIFSEPTFSDSLGNSFYNQYSMKSCEYCDAVKLSIIQDLNLNVTYDDWNMTSITNLCLYSNVSGNIPLQIYKTINYSQKILNTNISMISAKSWKCINLSIPQGLINYNIKWGYNSTTLKLNYSNNTQEVWIAQDAGSGNSFTILKWNISSIPNGVTIYSAGLNLWALSVNLGESCLAARYNSTNWSVSMGASYALSVGVTNKTNTTCGGTVSGWKEANVTIIIKEDYIYGRINSSIKLYNLTYNTTTYNLYNADTYGIYYGNVGTSANQYENRVNVGGSGNRPFLNISYSDVTSCSCGTPATCINWQWNMSCYCNITSPYYCPYYNITLDSTSGTWGVSTNITARFNFTSFITGQIINLSGLGYLNVT